MHVLVNLGERMGRELECTEIKGSSDGCNNQEAALRSVERRVVLDLRYLREQPYIAILTICNATEFGAVSDDGGHREGKFVEAAIHRQRKFETRRL